MTDWFEHASPGIALLFVVPLSGVYAAVRLVLPIGPGWVLQSIGLLSLFTAVYAAGMATIQRETRRFFAHLFLSHSSLVLVGLELHTELSLTASLCLWFSVILSLGGFGLTAPRPGGTLRPALAFRLPRAVRALAHAGRLLPAHGPGQRRIPGHTRLHLDRVTGR